MLRKLQKESGLDGRFPFGATYAGRPCDHIKRKHWSAFAAIFAMNTPPNGVLRIWELLLTSFPFALSLSKGLVALGKSNT